MLTVQLLFDSLARSCLFGIMALAIFITYRTCGFLNFNLATPIAICPYVAWVLRGSSYPSAQALLAAILSAAVFGVATEYCVFRPLRNRNASSQVLLLASIGLLVASQNVISLLLGDRTQSLKNGLVQSGLSVMGLYVVPAQIAFMVFFMLLFVGIGITAKRPWGLQVRALAADNTLAASIGIRAEIVRLSAAGTASALAGIAGLLLAWDSDMTPQMGMPLLLMGLIASFIGGMRSVPGVALGAIVLGLCQGVAARLLGGQWQTAVSFALLVLLIIFMPKGLALGNNHRN